LPPKPTLVTKNLEHFTQILYTPDISLIILMLDVKPGSVIVESGTGSCSLTLSLSNAVGKQGKVFSYEYNLERYENSLKFKKLHGMDNVKMTNRDVYNKGFLIESQLSHS